MTQEQFRPLLAKLMMAFGQPFGLTAGSADELTRTWLGAVGECEIRDLTSAVDQWVRTQKKWPSPAQIREDAWALTRQRKPLDRNGDVGFCSRCHCTDLIELANGRLMPLHADNCPGLHEMDHLSQQHALYTNRAVWRNGMKPQPES